MPSALNAGAFTRRGGPEGTAVSKEFWWMLKGEGLLHGFYFCACMLNWIAGFEALVLIPII